MPDLTIGEVGKALVLTLFSINKSVSPPVNEPLNLAGATVTLEWLITSAKNSHQPPTDNRIMTILNSDAGIVQYAFQEGDLVKPLGMGKSGQFRYTLKIEYQDGSILYPANDGLFVIKDDSVL